VDSEPIVTRRTVCTQWHWLACRIHYPEKSPRPFRAVDIVCIHSQESSSSPAHRYQLMPTYPLYSAPYKTFGIVLILRCVYRASPLPCIRRYPYGVSIVAIPLLFSDASPSSNLRRIPSEPWHYAASLRSLRVGCFASFQLGADYNTVYSACQLLFTSDWLACCLSIWCALQHTRFILSTDLISARSEMNKPYQFAYVCFNVFINDCLACWLTWKHYSIVSLPCQHTRLLKSSVTVLPPCSDVLLPGEMNYSTKRIRLARIIFTE